MRFLIDYSRWILKTRKDSIYVELQIIFFCLLIDSAFDLFWMLSKCHFHEMTIQPPRMMIDNNNRKENRPAKRKCVFILFFGRTFKFIQSRKSIFASTVPPSLTQRGRSTCALNLSWLRSSTPLFGSGVSCPPKGHLTTVALISRWSTIWGYTLQTIF